MEDALKVLVAKIAETNTGFAPTANIRDELNIDSVRAFELVFEIERAFKVEFPEERLRDVVTFADLCGVVQSLKARS